ncbi:flavodoxin family protein [uncultured Amphritea sp.]|uniref:flavodoxin family protein n=1 Tax=uncultured Amphritea sp. TaxID=981605 RepID=UPI00263976A2|nr:flavodoxin family protein [uncultured Amphritea sp.]
MKKLLIVAHAPSVNTRRMAEAVLQGTRHPDIDGVTCRWVEPLNATPDDLLNCDAIILGTTENLGYMSGALKDFFDRCYYPCLEQKQGLPCALYVRAGHDGTGTCKAVETICTGLRWNWTQPPLVCRGEWQDQFLQECETLGATMAAGLEMGIY